MLPAAALTLGVALAANTAAAQEWPTKPVRIVAPFAPGGTADTLGRAVADKLSEVFKQQFYVENKPGAGGVVGSQQVAHAEPDGYTLVISGIASHVLAPISNDKTGYDPVKDFTHIAYLGGPPIVFVTTPRLNAKTLPQLVALGKSAKTPLTYASPGAGTNGHIVAEYFARKTGMQVEHVPYRGAALGITDVVAGHLDFGSMTWTTASGQIAAKTVIPVAITADRRLPEYPDVATLKEAGYPDMVSTTWFSLSGPPGMHPDIVRRLNAEVVKALALPDIQDRLRQDAILTEPMTADEFTKFVAAEVARWRPIVKESGLGTPGKVN